MQHNALPSWRRVVNFWYSLFHYPPPGWLVLVLLVLLAPSPSRWACRSQLTEGWKFAVYGENCSMQGKEGSDLLGGLVPPQRTIMIYQFHPLAIKSVFHYANCCVSKQEWLIWKIEEWFYCIKFANHDIFIEITSKFRHAVRWFLTAMTDQRVSVW